VPELSGATQERLREMLGPAAAVANPVDMVASASADDFASALQMVLTDDQIDAVIVIFTPPLVTDAGDVARAVGGAARGADKPILANFVAAPDVADLLHRQGDESRPIPVFRSPEPAALALGRIADHADWRRRDPGVVPDLAGVDPAAALERVDRWLADGPDSRWLDADQAADLLGYYGIPVIETRRVETPDEAAGVADELGYPLALKAASGSLVHKTDVGGLQLGLGSAAEVRAAFVEMEASLGDRLGAAVLQPMAESGVETIVGVVQDPSFGPLVMFGMGGVATELLGDRAFRIVPVTDTDAAELVRSIRGAPLLFGYRGAATADVAGLEDLILRVSTLADDLPELAELDLNPVIVTPSGAVAVDAKVRLERVETGPPSLVRRIR
jgi:acyl-CoA synthetase (NDP forming)